MNVELLHWDWKCQNYIIMIKSYVLLDSAYELESIWRNLFIFNNKVLESKYYAKLTNLHNKNVNVF